MRIALKITLALTLWTIGVLVVMSDRELEHELELIDRDLAEGLVLMGRALQPLVEHAWQHGGDEEVGQVLREVYASEQAIRLRWLGPDAVLANELEGELVDAVQASIATGEERVLVWPPEHPITR